jgi:hypothetical protein
MVQRVTLAVRPLFVEGTRGSREYFCGTLVQLREN